jgi:type IV pilus assembly protein PilN
VGAVAGIYVLQDRKIKDYETKIVALKEESARLAPQLAKIRKLQAEREEVNKRLAIIAALDKDRYLHVRMMNDLAVNVPDNCWLTEVNETGGTKMSLEGITFSNFIIADFMTSLEGSGRFGEVALAKAEEGDIDGVRVVKFAISASLVN